MQRLLIFIHLFALSAMLAGAAEEIRIADDLGSRAIVQMVQRSDLFSGCGSCDAQSVDDLHRLEAMDRAKVISTLLSMLQHPDETTRMIAVRIGRDDVVPEPFNWMLNAHAIDFLDYFQAPPAEVLPLLRARLPTLADDLRKANFDTCWQLLREADALISYLISHGDRQDIDALADVAEAVTFHGSSQAVANGRYVRGQLDFALQDTPIYKRSTITEGIACAVLMLLGMLAISFWQHRHFFRARSRKSRRQDWIESPGI